MNMSEQNLTDEAKALLTQQHQATKAEQRLGDVQTHLSKLEEAKDAQSEVLDQLF